MVSNRLHHKPLPPPCGGARKAVEQLAGDRIQVDDDQQIVAKAGNAEPVHQSPFLVRRLQSQQTERLAILRLGHGQDVDLRHPAELGA